jgi:hypothetical protein
MKERSSPQNGSNCMEDEKRTLRNWLPYEATTPGSSWEGGKFLKYLDVEILYEFSISSLMFKKWPGSHKNVLNWVVLANGYAVGWNENDSIGWSFPVIKYQGAK